MKVTVQKEEILKRLSNIQNIVEKKNTMPILNHFLLTADTEGSYITATDLETAFKEPIALTVADQGKMCIPARKLFEIVREVDGEIVLEAVDGQWLKIKSGKSHFRLACLSEKDFPAWPPLEDTEEITIPSGVLLDMIDRTLYAAGESDTRYVLNGLHLHLNTDGLLTVVGTDGHRLALTEKTLETKVREERKMILSRKSVAELRRFLDSAGPDVRFVMGKNHVLFQIGDVHFLTRLIEGTYPNYRQVLPLENDKVMTADRNALMRALRRVSIMSKERSSAVKIEIGPQEMVISASNPDLGEASDEMAVTYTGESLSTAFNARYILDALDVMDSEMVVMKLKEALSAALILEEGREDYKSVVMPMRL